jgi:hypothetical protein
MPEPKYGSLEGCPVRFNDNEAWVFAQNAWHRTNSAEVLMGARVMEAGAYRTLFGELPLLPDVAFTGEPWASPGGKRKAALSPEEREIIDPLEKSRGRPLTEQEINLSLEQARAIGDL